ncbi:MAG: hypothetical protein R3C39_07865 [Dehalococcoidia bacterium]
MKARRVHSIVTFCLVLLAAFAVACGSGDGDADVSATAGETAAPATGGGARSYLMGFSAMPSELTDDGYREALDTAAQNGEVVLLQRAPDWASFLPGASVSDELAAVTLADEAAAEGRGLRLAYAIDVFDPASRGRLAGLPERYAGEDLSNPDLRHAFVGLARFVTLNYRPAYLVLGVEVNAAFEANPDAYEAYVEAYEEARLAVHEISPDTQVLVTFQYEQLLGLVPWEPPHAPRWDLLRDFEGLDMIGLTSYPSFVFSVARKVPPDYYSQLVDHTSLPIAFVSTGFASAPAREGLNSSTPAEQRRFLERLLVDAEALHSPLLIWFASRDLEFADSPPLDLLASIGLRTADGEPKEAWPAWEDALARPLDPAVQQSTPAASSSAAFSPR